MEPVAFRILSRASTSVALAACLLAASACQSSTVNGPDDQSLTQTTARSVTIHRGGNETLSVAIDRQNFTGPVTVSIAQLPSGVSADDTSMKVDATHGTFILRASKTADLVTNQAVEITVEGPDGRKAIQYVRLTVKS